MNVNPSLTYNSFSIDGITANNLSGDFVAGLLAAMNIIQRDDYFQLNNEIISSTNIVPLLYNYIIANDIIDNIKLYKPDPNKIGIWVRNTKDTSTEKYYLYQFGSEGFINGLINMCNVYGEDFRYYILGPPFSYNYSTEETIKYDVKGYDIKDYTVNVRVPVAITPYYGSGIHEDDPFAYDFI